MTIFLTSSPSFGHDGPMNPANGLVEALLKAVRPKARAVFVASAADEHDFSAAGAWNMRTALEDAGMSFASFVLLERRNAPDTEKLIAGADFLVFSGGHVPTQNRFFRDISLRERLRGFNDVVMGISAGTMNAADTVYAQPELEGESFDPDYERFLPGLGLTKKMILPHYQETKDLILDGKRLFEEITYPDSVGREFFALPDGSYLYGEDGREEFRGEVWRIADGTLTRFG